MGFHYVRLCEFIKFFFSKSLNLEMHICVIKCFRPENLLSLSLQHKRSFSCLVSLRFDDILLSSLVSSFNTQRGISAQYLLIRSQVIPPTFILSKLSNSIYVWWISSSLTGMCWSATCASDTSRKNKLLMDPSVNEMYRTEDWGLRPAEFPVLSGWLMQISCAGLCVLIAATVRCLNVGNLDDLIIEVLLSPVLLAGTFP